MSAQIENSHEQSSKSKVMTVIAYAVTGLVLTATFAIAAVAVWKYGDGEKAVQFIVQTLLPLWGTWFGTVLAFYFGKENFETAARANQELLNKLSVADRKYASLPVTSVMTPYDKITALTMEEDRDMSLEDILDRAEFEHFNRFPVFDSKDGCKLEYMIHRLVMLEYLHDTRNENTAKTLNGLLTANSKVRKILKDSVAFVSEQATFLDVKREMDKLEHCEDVFVTKTGKNTDEVTGWITDNDLCEYGKV